MKLYKTIQIEYKEKNGIDIESELLVYIIKELMIDESSRKNILNSFQSFIENNSSHNSPNKKFLLDIFERYENVKLLK
jgi:NADPH-dependent 7-cyano-7-deazaguanine reductase QueF